MKIVATLVTDVLISDDEVIKITVKKLCEKYNLKPKYYIDKHNNLNEDFEESMGSRSRTVTTGHRIATEEDRMVLKMIKELMTDHKGYINWEKL